MHRMFSFTGSSRSVRDIVVRRRELISQFNAIAPAKRALDAARLLRAQIRALSRDLESMLTPEELLQL